MEKTTISLAKEGDLPVLTLGGGLTVENCAELKEAFLSAIVPGKDLVVELKDTGGIDLSFIQVLVSAEKTLGSTGNALRVGGASIGDLGEALERAGFAGAAFRRE